MFIDYIKFHFKTRIACIKIPQACLKAIENHERV